MLAKTQDYAGKTKRTKPRRQSGAAVKNLQGFGILQEYQVEELDQDLQRLRRKCLLLDIEHVLRKTNSMNNDDTSCTSTSTGDSVWEKYSETRIYTRRSKPRRQSGPAVAHLTGTCRESKELARAASRLEEFDQELAHKPIQRRVSATPSVPLVSE